MENIWKLLIAHDDQNILIIVSNKQFFKCFPYICSRAIFSVCVQAYKKAKSTDPKCLWLFVHSWHICFSVTWQSDINMEIMVRPIIRVGNRRYRKNPILNKDTETTDQDVTGNALNCF